MCVLVQGWKPCLVQVLQGVNLTSTNAVCLLKEPRQAVETNPPAPLSTPPLPLSRTHKHNCESTVKASCPECAHRRAHTYTQSQCIPTLH